MNAYLMTWNPDRWAWAEASAEIQFFREAGFLARRWSCGRTRRIRSGDRVFFLMQGRQGRGLFASGYVRGEPFAAEHFSDPAKQAVYVNVVYDALLDPVTERLDRNHLSAGLLGQIRWATQGGGIRIPDSSLPALEQLWAEHLRARGVGEGFGDHPDADDAVFIEGRAEATTVMAVERSREARAVCIAVKGSSCQVCGLSFGDRYGQIGEGFIHVHHTLMLGSAIGPRPTDPRRDLEPVCPNCHCMLHKRVPPFTVQELREIMRDQTAKSTGSPA